MSLPDNGHDTTPSPTPAHHDATTGLHLRAATALVSLRIARSSRGPLNPPLRHGSPSFQLMLIFCHFKTTWFN